LSTTASENRPIKKIHSSQKRSKAASMNVIKNLDSGVDSITKKMIDRNPKLTTGFEVTLLPEERQLDVINEEKE
jgi:hypothetical protein